MRRHIHILNMQWQLHGHTACVHNVNAFVSHIETTPAASSDGDLPIILPKGWQYNRIVVILPVDRAYLEPITSNARAMQTGIVGVILIGEVYSSSYSPECNRKVIYTVSFMAKGVYWTVQRPVALQDWNYTSLQKVIISANHNTVTNLPKNYTPMLTFQQHHAECTTLTHSLTNTPQQREGRAKFNPFLLSLYSA